MQRTPFFLWAGIALASASPVALAGQSAEPPTPSAPSAPSAAAPASTPTPTPAPAGANPSAADASANQPAADPGTPLFDSGRLIATSGLSQLEGAGGGGLVPWALITGYGTRDAIGGDAHATVVRLPGYTLYASGIAVGLFDRLELSYTRQWFDTGRTGGALGLGDGFTFRQDVYGTKVRLFGNAVYDQDTLLPQVAAGVQFKSDDHADILRAIGARSAQGTDFYLAATKLLLGQSLLIDTTLRATRANQTGLLGFGGDRSDAYHPEVEASAALLLRRDLAVGAELRTKPDNLRFAHESNWYDAFITYFISKNLSVAVAYVDLGSIATRKDQDGVYVSLQVGF